MGASVELCAVLEATSSTLPFDSFTELFGACWGVDPERVRRVLLGAAPLESLSTDAASALLDLVSQWGEDPGALVVSSAPQPLCSASELLASDARPEILRWAHAVPPTRLVGLAEIWATLGAQAPAKVTLVCTAGELEMLALATACVATGSFLDRAAAVKSMLADVELAGPSPTAPPSGSTSFQSDAHDWFEVLTSSEVLARVSDEDRRRTPAGFCGCGGADEGARAVVTGTGCAAAGVPGCEGGCGAAAVVTAALCWASIGFAAPQNVALDRGALVDAVSELGELFASGGGPENLSGELMGCFAAPGAMLALATGDPSAFAAPFGFASAAELPDELLNRCLHWWYQYRAVHFDTGEGTCGPPAELLDALLCEASRDGELHREVSFEVLSVSSPALPPRVAAAFFSSDPDWCLDLGEDFAFAASGWFGHRWDPGEVLDALEGAPELRHAVLDSAPGVEETLASLGDAGAARLPAELIAASMSQLSWSPWFSRVPARSTALLVAAFERFVGPPPPPEGCDGVATHPRPWVSDLWATVWSLATQFKGSPDELVAVAAASTFGVPATPTN